MPAETVDQSVAPLRIPVLDLQAALLVVGRERAQYLSLVEATHA